MTFCVLSLDVYVVLGTKSVLGVVSVAGISFMFPVLVRVRRLSAAKTIPSGIYTQHIIDIFTHSFLYLGRISVA